MPRKIVKKKKIQAKGKPPLTKPVKLWLKALRSGKFAQGMGHLDSGWGKYCCLGVACVVFEEETGVRLKRSIDGRISGGELDGDKVLVREWLGIRTPDGEFNGKSLIGFNDTSKLSFKKIAAIIESQPEGLFITNKKEKTK